MAPAPRRVVQEALTNVRKHARGATAQVLLRHRDHDVELCVVNGPATNGAVPAGVPGTEHVRMPGMDGIEATRRLIEAGDGPRVLMLTTFDLDECVHETMKAGASGFMLKNAPPDELAAAVRSRSPATQRQQHYTTLRSCR